MRYDRGSQNQDLNARLRATSIAGVQDAGRGMATAVCPVEHVVRLGAAASQVPLLRYFGIYHAIAKRPLACHSAIAKIRRPQPQQRGERCDR